MVTELLTIRYPTIKDLEDIVHLNRVSLPENYAVAYFIELIKSWHETSCVAVVDNQTIGYIILRIEKSSLTPWRPRSKSKGHIISVAVSPNHRRKGIAEQMMFFILEKIVDLGNIEKVSLEVRETNSAAVKLYQKLHFIIAKVLKRYYSDGEDAYLMELNLQ